MVAFALGDQHTVIMKQDGSVWSTAITLHGGRIPSRGIVKSFIKMIPSGVMAMAAGLSFTMVLKQDGSLWGMGRNFKGQLGDGTKLRKLTFSFVKDILGPKAVAAGGYHSMVLSQKGQVWTTGWNNYGQLGDGFPILYRTRFFAVMDSEDSQSKAVAIAAGDFHSIVLKRDGSVWAAGRNNNGQLGDGSKDDRSRFVKVMSSDAANVAAGSYHSVVVKQDGSVWTAGCNQYGQIGDGLTTDRVNYVKVVSSKAKAVAAGGQHSMMLKQDGSVWATGNNQYGQLGDGSTAHSNVFLEAIYYGARAVAAGSMHSMVIMQGGSLWAAGSNKYGQFGDGSVKSESKLFVRLAPFRDGKGQGTMLTSTSLNLTTMMLITPFLNLTGAKHSVDHLASTTKGSDAPERAAASNGIDFSARKQVVCIGIILNLKDRVENVLNKLHYSNLILLVCYVTI